MNVLCLALAAAQLAPCGQGVAWRPVATELDRQRLRDWRTTWTEALAEVRAKGVVDADPLFDPDRALDNPLPSPGTYRCRFVKLGASGLARGDWGRCEVGPDSLVKLDGPQRPAGKLFADQPTRAVFLGTLVLGDETRPLPYGRDDGRDLAGFVERVGEARWRVTLPQPRFESTLDLIELVPA